VKAVQYLMMTGIFAAGNSAVAGRYKTFGNTHQVITICWTAAESC